MGLTRGPGRWGAVDDTQDIRVQTNNNELRLEVGSENREINDLGQRCRGYPNLLDITPRQAGKNYQEVNKVNEVNLTTKLWRQHTGRKETRVGQKSSPSPVSKIPLTPPL